MPPCRIPQKLCSSRRGLESGGLGRSNRRGDRSLVGDPVTVGACPLPDGGGVLPVGTCRPKTSLVHKFGQRRDVGTAAGAPKYGDVMALSVPSCPNGFRSPRYCPTSSREG
jgi:hypothetical protein